MKDSNENQVNFHFSSLYKGVAVSLLAGGIDTCVNHPLVALKQRHQSGYSFTLQPKILYRGLGSSLSFMAPIITMRMSVNDSLKNYLISENDPKHNAKKILCSFSAGIISSFLTNPTELIMTYQQKLGGTMPNAINSIVRKNGNIFSLYKGFFPISVRDGIFTSGFLSGTPIIKKKIMPILDNNEHVSSLLAGYMSGLIAALTSQPPDTIRAFIHDSAADGKKPSVTEAFKSIYKKDGLFGLYKGGGYRCVRVISSATILPLAIEKLNASFKKKC